MKLERPRNGHPARLRWVCRLKACPCLIILILSAFFIKWQYTNFIIGYNWGLNLENQTWMGLKPAHLTRPGWWLLWISSNFVDYYNNGSWDILSVFLLLCQIWILDYSVFSRYFQVYFFLTKLILSQFCPDFISITTEQNEGKIIVIFG